VRLRRHCETLYAGALLAIGLGVAAAAAVFQAWTVAVICLVAGLFKVIDVNFDARLHDAIPSEMRATLAAVRNFAGLTAMTLVLLIFGWLADVTSYRAAFVAAGGALVLAGFARLVLARRA
jgi:MFS family permease